MIYNTKVIVVIPAGRRRYMEVLFPYLLREYNIIDEIRYWVNTKVKEDIEWMIEKSRQYDKVKLDFEYAEAERVGEFHNIGNFFKKCIDPDTVYVRLDDDIVWLEHDYIRKTVNYVINHPDNFIVYSNIINNSITTHIHQRIGCFNHIKEQLIYDWLGNKAYHNGELCEQIHSQFIKDIKNNNLNKYKFNEWIMNLFERVFVNAISWRGEEFVKFDGVVPGDEELFVSVDKPKSINKFNIINGNVLCAHFAFWGQREYMDKTNILEEYKKLSLLTQNKFL